MKLVLLLNLFSLLFLSVLSQSCKVDEIFIRNNVCSVDNEIKSETRIADDPVFILYSVNPAEGFNLRRDVYLRMAIFLKYLRASEGYSNAHLVLPVFHHLYHWKSHFRQTNMFWNHFFDVDSLKLYTKVLDMWEFFDIIRQQYRQKSVEIGEVYLLQHFEAMFETGVFVDKFEETICSRTDNDNYHFLEYYNITEKTITCLNFQGSASLLFEVLEAFKERHHTPGTPRIVLFSVKVFN